MSGCIASIVTNFLDEDAQVEATFQVSLFPPRNPQSYLDNVIKDIPWTEAKLKLMKIDKKITFDPFQPNKMTGLHVACQHGFEEIACKYIQKKKNYEQPLNDTNIHRCTPLHYAVRGKHLHIAKVLLDAGADLNCWDMWGDTPLIISLTQNNLPMAKLLLEPERTDLNINAQTAHVMEFKEHHFKLLMHNGTPDLQDDIAIYYSVSGRTALHQAAKNGMEEIVQLLLTTRKVDFTLQDSAGQLAWHKAAKYGHTKILTLLLAQGLDPLCRIGETRNGIEPGAKIKEYDGHLNTALHVAAKWNKPEVVSYLVDSFPDIVPLQNHLGETALMLAVCMRQGNMVDLLLRKSLLKGVDVGVNIEDKTGRRPIHYSVIDRSGKCMKLLLGREEIEVDVKDRDGMTLLDLAAKYGQACHIEQLLELEIYVERGCEQWRKAFRHANDRSNWRIYRALFSSEKINDLLDADYATLKDMVLSVPKDRLDARSKM
jgi:ankyrin repeat protein